MTWAQDVGGAKRLRVTATRGCFAAAQPGSGGGVPHKHGETELRFKGGEAVKEAEEGSRRGVRGPTPAP
jgi:hypothetical protein